MKLIGSDYDGTLNHGGIDEEKLSAIRRWRAAGHIFGVVSGRGPDFLAELQEKLGDNFDFYASCNGGVAVDAVGKPLFDYRCEGVDARAFVADLLAWGAPFAYVNYDDVCVRVGNADTTDEIEYLLEDMPDLPYFHKMAVFLPGPDEAGALVERVREKYGDKVNPLQNWWCVDIAPYGVDKAAGLRRLAARFGVAEADIIAVGDNLNDAAMVGAFRGYAMAQGSEELKAVAAFVTESVTDLIVKELEE
ncbi:MAG: HAD hydrolase family protein [Clostridia bacterium]|nr:HAD hydrolase family protein [Clostridia bacterium]